MQYCKNIYPIAALLAIFMVSSCGDDITEIEMRDGKYRVNVGVESNTVVEVATRATSGYEDFSGSQYNGWVMGVVANSNGIVDKGSATYSWNGSTGKWTSDLWLGPADFDFYAYIPYDTEASNVDLDVKGAAAKLIFKGQPAFARKDLLVSVGANNKGKQVTDGRYTATVSQTGENHVDFRMNHLLAKLKIQFQLPEGHYDDLRKIEITSITFGSDVNNSRNYNITCDYSSTMTPSYVAAATNANEKAAMTLDYDGAGTSLLGGKALTLSKATPGPSLYDYVYVIPAVINNNDKKLKMTITYNVFTKDSKTGNYVETRHQVKATNNSLVVCKKNNVATEIEAAKEYTLTVKVVPTYLYMLADVDQSSSIVLN